MALQSWMTVVSFSIQCFFTTEADAQQAGIATNMGQSENVFFFPPSGSHGFSGSHDDQPADG